jgi:hypothetical protein
MKLIAVYNVFDGEEFLEESIKSIRYTVDEIYAVVQDKAYNGFEYNKGKVKANELKDSGWIDKVFEWSGNSQLNKRQTCLDVAKQNKATHFIGMDCDEIYDSIRFDECVKEVIDNDYSGSYCKIKTYFKNLDWTIGLDNYYVPFVHKIKPNSVTGSKDYPVTVDPRRGINGGAKEVDIIMHHYSWVRDDINIKINSHDSKKQIIESGLIEDYKNAQLGYFIKHYGKEIKQS